MVVSDAQTPCDHRSRNLCVTEAMLRPRKVPPRRNHNFRMSRRAVLRSGGLAAAGALPLPLAGWRAPRARAAPPPPGVTVRVEQLAGGLGPEDCPASLAFRLRGEDGADLAWEDLVSPVAVGEGNGRAPGVGD